VTEKEPRGPKDVGGSVAGTAPSGKGGASATSLPLDECMGRSLDQLANAFTASARRWELLVYPSLFAFFVLAAYGFYLVYSLTKDVARVVEEMRAVSGSMTRVAANMEQVAGNMLVISEDMGSMTAEIRQMSTNIAAMTEDVNAEAALMTQMTGHIANMDVSMAAMTTSMDQMRYHIAVMNQSVSRPMSFMNSVMPW